MKFEFTTTATVNTEVWYRSNKKLEQDLRELTTNTIPEEELNAYLKDMINALKPVNNEQCDGMLFLMYDAPSSMPADARVEFVYKPTYIAATIMMTAMNRYDAIARNNEFRKTISAVLEATLGRNFRGAGYYEYEGFMDTLEIFAMGDTLEFIAKYPMINERFASEFKGALEILETQICSGTVINAWSGEDYSSRGKVIMDMYQKANKSESEYVWYACYGSNINKTRFMRYINNCTDTTPPVEDRPFVFNSNIYFAKSSGQWDNGGIAFLDETCEGSSYGRVYKITREQYEEVKVQEGRNYTKKLELGEIEGIPVYSFTDTQKNEPIRTPSDNYFKTILDGLKECYNGILSDRVITIYLINAVFPGYTFDIAHAIKKSAHYISNEQLCEATDLSLSDVTTATEWLVEHNVIQQDQRSIRAGHRINAPEAFFFTVDSHNGRKLVSVMVELMRKAEEGTDSISSGETEGGRHLMISTRVERSSRNRIEAIRLHGYKCQVCGFDFAETYGEHGRNYIEVHHINPLAEQNGEHTVNPETDLVCLCANCHRMAHRNRNSVLSIDELKELVSK